MILDEFQRFKYLLDGEDEAVRLAQALFNYRDVRVLLLSATPYKMLSLDHEREDDHYPDFMRTLEFLYNDPDEVGRVRQEIRAFRTSLYETQDGQASRNAAREQVQARLLRVMCRTERVGLTRNLNAMLADRDTIVPLEADDLRQAAAADCAGRAVGARDTIEYWKSSPYLLNFLKHYELRRKIDAALSSPTPALLDAVRQADGQMIREAHLEAYQPLEAGNARMRYLFNETLERGLWRLLWMPPSLPYSEPAGAYQGIGSISKALVFSAWNAVPDAVAAIASYEAERRMLAELGREVQHSELYERLRPLLRFARDREGRPTGMPVLAWMMPSPTLAEAIDPLEIALRLGGGTPLPLQQLLREAEGACRKLLETLPPGEEGSRPDQRWYWAAPALLDAGSHLCAWLRCEEAWPALRFDRNTGGNFREHLQQFLNAAAGTLRLGLRPADLARVLAELALAAPGTCALRALRHVSSDLAADAPEILTAAARIAEGFRTLFNLPETIAFLRGKEEETDADIPTTQPAMATTPFPKLIALRPYPEPETVVRADGSRIAKVKCEGQRLKVAVPIPPSGDDIRAMFAPIDPFVTLPMQNPDGYIPPEKDLRLTPYHRTVIVCVETGKSFEDAAAVVIAEVRKQKLAQAIFARKAGGAASTQRAGDAAESRGEAEPTNDPTTTNEAYWRLALRYATEGNLQAVLDEHTHVLVESLGLADQASTKVVKEVAESLAEALSIRTVQVKIDELHVEGDAIQRSDFFTRCRFALRFGDLRDDRGGTLARAETVREAFNSPFRPFVLASTSIGQEGLDFHTWCHAVVHWNLPSNPVDLEQREGRVHRFKGYAVRKNIAEHFGLAGLCAWDGRGDPWQFLFALASKERPNGFTELIPYWIYEDGQARIERRIPLLPFSREVRQLEDLRSGLALYRVVFGQPRQEDLLKHLRQRGANQDEGSHGWRINLEPPL